MTGYQRNESMEKLIPKFISYFNSEAKSIPFIQFSLRSAKDIFLYGGHSTVKLNERWFNLRYDHRREIVKNSVKNSYHFSKPYRNLQECKMYRELAEMINKPKHNSIGSLKGDAYLSILKRMLVRICMTDPLTFGVKENLSRVEIIRLMNTLGLKTLPNFLSKQRGLKPIYNSIPPSPQVLSKLIKFKQIFTDFPIELLIRSGV